MAERVNNSAMSDRQKKVVVIGAGIGGLSAALRLTHAGLDVTVVEAQATPGGKIRQFDSAAGPVDAGPTVLTLRHVFETLFDEVGHRLDDHVTLRAEPVLARHFWPDGSTLDLSADKDISAAAIEAFAGPGEADAFRRFSRICRRLFAAFEPPMMQAPRPLALDAARAVLRDPGLIPAMIPGRSLSDLVRRNFRDPRLRQLFGRYATYVGGSPYAAPALLALIWQAEAAGVWRVQGGMQALARAIADLAQAKGAEFRYHARVARIEMQGGRVAAVHIDDKDRIAADWVVFNGDPRALSQGLLGPGATSAVDDAATEPRSLSAVVWAFAGRPSGVELHHHNVFFGQDARSEFDPLRLGMLPEDPTLYVCAQDRGSGIAPPETERFEIIMNAPAGFDGGAEEVDACRSRTFPVLKKRGLRFSPEPNDTALTTPAGFEALCPGSQGALYGRSPHGLTAAFQRPTARTPVTGLFLAGGGAHPGAGVPMATLSGRHAAEAILTDLGSTSMSARTVTPGGMSTASATTAAAPSR